MWTGKTMTRLGSELDAVGDMPGEMKMARAKIIRHFDDARGQMANAHQSPQYWISYARRFLYGTDAEARSERQWWADLAGLDADDIADATRRAIEAEDAGKPIVPPKWVLKHQTQEINR